LSTRSTNADAPFWSPQARACIAVIQSFVAWVSGPSVATPVVRRVLKGPDAGVISATSGSYVNVPRTHWADVPFGEQVIA